MIYSEKKVTIEDQSLKNLKYLAPLEWILIFDIETTGFHRLRDHVISITILTIEAKQPISRQWFAESQSEELLMLTQAKYYFDSKPIHITYNGHSFDIPFLRTKYNNYSISIGLNKSKCYDLYRFARKSLQLQSYTLKNIEKALNLERIDQISGKECTEMYAAFLINNDLELAKAILDHNFEDVFNLVDLLTLVEHLSPEQLNDFKVTTIKTPEFTWYIASQSISGAFYTINLWGYSASLTDINTLNFFFSNGSTYIRDDILHGECTCQLKIPCYCKIIEQDELICAELSAFDRAIFESLEPHQLIIKYNGLWIQSHTLAITQLIMDFYR